MPDQVLYGFYSYSFTVAEVAILVLASILIGMGKTGVQGAGMIAIPLLALIFGGRASTGLILPILIFADVFGVNHYHQHARWENLSKILPTTALGIAVGALAGYWIDDQLFRTLMAIIIFACVGLMLWQEKNPNPIVPSSPWFIRTIGIVIGFTTMIGNLAAPVVALYLLSLRFPKNQLIGTAAWLFLLMNLAKVPLHIWIWGTITESSFMLNLALIPAIALGAYLGVKIVKMIPESAYRLFVITVTAIAALAMII